MENDYTDSLFTSDTEALNDASAWSDLRLIHESEHGWCAVYSCLYEGRRVAVKTLREEYRDSPLHQRLLRKELAVWQMLDHENIAMVLWHKDIPGLGLSILMEYVDGISLKDFLSRRRLSVKEIRHITEQICSAVAYIHSRGVIHCDLKPSNIMVTDRQHHIKLIDFGMCRGAGFEKLDFPGGTRNFTGPENLQADSTATPQTDIYSIGRLIELMDTKGRFRSVSRRCMADNPDERPKSADEIMLMVKRCTRRKALRSIAACVAIASIITGGIAWKYFSKPQQSAAMQPVAEQLTNTPDTLATDQVDIENEPQVPPIDVEIADRALPQRDVETPPLAETAPELSFDEKLYRVTMESAKTRFAQHLALIDTMKSKRSQDLVYVKHWRWLAKQDVRRWLEQSMSAENPRLESYMADVEKAIVNYSDREDIALEEYNHLKNSGIIGLQSPDESYIVGDRLYSKRLLEDGTWIRESSSLTPAPTSTSNR